MLTADVERTALLDEEQELWSAVGGNEDGGEGEADDAKADGEGASPSVDWSAEEWTAKLARLAEVGQMLVASGADAAEAKVGRRRCCLAGAPFPTIFLSVSSSVLVCVCALSSSSISLNYCVSCILPSCSMRARAPDAGVPHPRGSWFLAEDASGWDDNAERRLEDARLARAGAFYGALSASSRRADQPPRE